MKSLMKYFAVILLCDAAVTPAMAVGFYGALDAGQSKAKDACPSLPGCKDTANAARVALGFQFAPLLGVEVSYGAYGKATLGTLGGITGDWQANGAQVSATGALPLGTAFSLIGKVGAARTTAKRTVSVSGTTASASATTTKMAYGLGAQYDFTKSFAVRAQYENLGTVGDTSTGGTTKLTLISAGIVIRF